MSRVTRWQGVWRRAIAAAVDPTHMPAGVLTCAVGKERAAVLSLSSGKDAFQLVLLERCGESFVPWGEPVIEPLLMIDPLGSADTLTLECLVGPVKIVEANRATWALAGKLAPPADKVGMQAGEQRVTGTVSDGYFAVVTTAVPPEVQDVEVFACVSDGQPGAGVRSHRMGPAVELTEI